MLEPSSGEHDFDAQEMMRRFYEIQLDAFRVVRDKLLISHSPTCTVQSESCYIASQDVAVQHDGKSWALFMPSCRVGYTEGRVWSAVSAYADDRGTVPLTLDHAANLFPWIKRKELKAILFLNCPVFLGGKKDYWLRRDAMRAIARAYPRRQRCIICGRRLPRFGDQVSCHTYLVSDPPFLKIGRTRQSVRKRWGGRVGETVRVTDNPRPVTVLASLCGDYEGDLHDRFSDDRVGGEWFRDTHQIREAFGIQWEGYEDLPLLGYV